MSKFDFLLDQTWVEATEELLERFDRLPDDCEHTVSCCAGVACDDGVIAFTYAGSHAFEDEEEVSEKCDLTQKAITFLPEMYRTLHEISEYANLLRLGGPAPHDLKDLYSGLMKSTKLAHALLNKMEQSS